MTEEIFNKIAKDIESMTDEEYNSILEESQEIVSAFNDEMEIGNLLWGHSRGSFKIDREKYQERFVQLLFDLGYDSYGVKERPVFMDKFIVRPYWWGDDDAPEANLPNFECPELDLEIRWYKYPLRDSYSNVEFTDELMEKLEEMVK